MENPRDKSAASCCWYCDRTFEREISHRHSIRKKFQSKRTANSSERDDFLGKREAFIESKRNGVECVRKTGVKETLKRTKYDNMDLIRPDDDVYPLEAIMPSLAPS